MDIYHELLANVDSLKSMPEENVQGMDTFLGGKVKVASLGDLSGFFRLSNDTLVHKAQKDLWRISEDGNGQVVIERLFDPNSKEPIRV
jgi:hypothetical protein